MIILKSILLSLCLLTGCDGSGNFHPTSTGDGRIVKAQIPDSTTGDIETIYWDTKLETFCEWTQVRDMKFCLPLRGKIISSVYSPCEVAYAGHAEIWTKYIRIDSLPIPRVFKFTKWANLTASKYNELLNGKYCVQTTIDTKKYPFWQEVEEVSVEEFVSR